ncbi:dymeclin isoform X1 [Prunus yedoensis var. nudiflora]|uniref:Dymeclin isoform X1 n=1 Tax=Prunus yedoensis var. nudiflora TaxID=2094558 RepID=A0A315AZE5_PRUYE|nr:dymeclin isoform X1 [Prunus yedoensis var. nudiflora]
MGAVPSTPRWGGSSSAARPLDTAEYLISTFIGDESFPISSISGINSSNSLSISSGPLTAFMKLARLLLRKRVNCPLFLAQTKGTLPYWMQVT